MPTGSLTVGAFSGFTAGADSTVANVLSNTDGTFGTMNTVAMSAGVAWASSNVDDTMGLNIRIVNGATILAASDAGGTFSVLEPAWSSTTSGTTNVVSFAYVNLTADKAVWDGASVEVQQTYTANMKDDGGVVSSVGAITFNIDYDILVEAKSGTALVTAINSATSAGSKSSSGTALVTAINSATSAGSKSSSGTALTTHSSTTGAIGSVGGADVTGTALVSAASTTTSTGSRATSGVGVAASVSAVVATGLKGYNTSIATANTTTTTSTGVAGRTDIAAVSATSLLTATGDRIILGSATATAVQTVSATGSKQTSAAASTVNSSVLSSNGFKAISDTLLITATATITGSGSSVSDFKSGFASVLSSFTLSTAGTKSALGTAELTLEQLSSGGTGRRRYGYIFG